MTATMCMDLGFGENDCSLQIVLHQVHGSHHSMEVHMSFLCFARGFHKI